MKCFARIVAGAVVAVISPTVSIAADVPLPYSDEVIDLADLGIDPANRPQIGTANKSQTVTAYGDISFAGFLMTGLGATVIFDMRDSVTQASPRKINVTGSFSADANAKDKMQTWIRGGDWDFNNNDLNFGSAGYANRNGPNLKISDGAVLHGLKSFSLPYGNPSYSTFEITGEGTVVTAKQVKVDYSSSDQSRMIVADSAEVVVNNPSPANGDFRISNNGKNCGLIVTNGASFINLSGKTQYLGDKGSGNYLQALDGGKVDVKSGVFYIGYSDNSNATTANDTLVRSAGTGSEVLLGTVYFGKGTAADGNHGCVMRAEEGGLVLLEKAYVSGHDNGFVVSNGTFETCGSGIIIQSNASNCFLRVSGASPKVVFGFAQNMNYALQCGFKFIVDLPAEGYVDATVPLIDSNMYGTFDSSVDFIFTGIEEMQENMRQNKIRKRTITVFDSYSQSGITSEMVKRWNNYLPEDSHLTWDGGKLILEVRVRFGLMLTVW